MNILSIGEFGLIDRIRSKFKSIKSKDIVTGIGDDAAVIKSKAKYFLLTTDTLVEGVHFGLRYFTFFDVGWKLLAVNLSDIAAMGGTPKYALVTLGLKKNMRISDIDGFYDGVASLAKKHGVTVIGGDIVFSPKTAFFTMDLYGEASKVVKRSGAKAGDRIYYIGPLGMSAVGLKMLEKKKKMTGGPKFINAHKNPMPLVKEGRDIARIATSMIDNSDGLARCLMEICRASKVGAEIRTSNIILPEIRKASASLKMDAISVVLDGGEDYGLMFTSDRRGGNIRGARQIGRITKGIQIVLIDDNGNRKKLSAKGYTHF